MFAYDAESRVFINENSLTMATHVYNHYYWFTVRSYMSWPRLDFDPCRRKSGYWLRAFTQIDWALGILNYPCGETSTVSIDITNDDIHGCQDSVMYSAVQENKRIKLSVFTIQKS